MDNLNRGVGNLEKQLVESKTENEKLKQTIENYSLSINLAKMIWKCAREVRTAEDVIHARAEENKSENKALGDWKDACSYELDKIKRLVGGYALSMAMIGVIETDSRSKTIPWAHYDFLNQNLYYSPAALKLFKIEETKTKSNPRDLLSYIKREYRRGIDEYLRSGKGLRHYKAETSVKYNKKPKDLMLSTYPFYDEEKAIGAAIFLKDPKISLHSRGTHKFEEDIQRTADRVFEQLKEYRISWK